MANVAYLLWWGLHIVSLLHYNYWFFFCKRLATCQYYWWISEDWLADLADWSTGTLPEPVTDWCWPGADQSGISLTPVIGWLEISWKVWLITIASGLEDLSDHFPIQWLHLVCSHFLIRKTGLDLPKDLNRSWIYKWWGGLAVFFSFFFVSVSGHLANAHNGMVVLMK